MFVSWAIKIFFIFHGAAKLPKSALDRLLSNIRFLQRNYLLVRALIFLPVTRRSGTARRLHILRDGFDSRLEPIAFDVYAPDGSRLEERKLTSQSPSIRYNLKITSVDFVSSHITACILSFHMSEVYSVDF